MSDVHDHLLDDLRAVAARMDPLPPEVAGAARDAFAWRSTAWDVATLVYDSVIDAELVGVRGGGRQVSFEGRDLTIDVDAGGDRLVGQVAPGAPGTAEIRHRSGAVTVPIDDLGRFFAEAVPPGPVSVRCRVRADRSEVTAETEWILL